MTMAAPSVVETDGHATTDMDKKTASSMFLTFPIEDSYLYCEKCKLKYEGDCPEHGPFIYINTQANHGVGSVKELKAEISEDGSPDKIIPGKDGSQASISEEMHTCTKCYLIFFKLEDLQKHQRVMHGMNDVEPGSPSNHPPELPGTKNIKTRKVINKISNTVIKDDSSTSDPKNINREVDDKGENKVGSPGNTDVNKNDNCETLESRGFSKGLNKVVSNESKVSEIKTKGRLKRNSKNLRAKVKKKKGLSCCNGCTTDSCECSRPGTPLKGQIDKKYFDEVSEEDEYDEYIDLNARIAAPDIERPFKCSYCGVAFTRDGHLQSHQRIHTGEKPFKCVVCGLDFAQLNNLRRHKRVHTAEYPYKCDICGIAFAESSNLKRHRRIHTGEKLYKCEHCGVSFTECSNLKRHKRTHTKEKPFKCDVCGVSFAVGCSLKTHMRVHTGEKPYGCGVCGAFFAQSSNLKKHKWTHAPEKPFKCDVCGCGFSDRSALKTHQRKHTGEKPYKCNLCDMGFADAGSFHRHKVVHTGVKPYKCDICGAAFTDHSNLKRHLRIHERQKAAEIASQV